MKLNQTLVTPGSENMAGDSLLIVLLINLGKHFKEAEEAKLCTVVYQRIL